MNSLCNVVTLYHLDSLNLPIYIKLSPLRPRMTRVIRSRARVYTQNVVYPRCKLVYYHIPCEKINIFFPWQILFKCVISEMSHFSNTCRTFAVFLLKNFVVIKSNIFAFLYRVYLK